MFNSQHTLWREVFGKLWYIVERDMEKTWKIWATRAHRTPFGDSFEQIEIIGLQSHFHDKYAINHDQRKSKKPVARVGVPKTIDSAILKNFGQRNIWETSAWEQFSG